MGLAGRMDPKAAAAVLAAALCASSAGLCRAQIIGQALAGRDKAPIGARIDPFDAAIVRIQNQQDVEFREPTAERVDSRKFRWQAAVYSKSGDYLGLVYLPLKEDLANPEFEKGLNTLLSHYKTSGNGVRYGDGSPEDRKRVLAQMEKAGLKYDPDKRAFTSEKGEPYRRQDRLSSIDVRTDQDGSLQVTTDNGRWPGAQGFSVADGAIRNPTQSR